MNIKATTKDGSSESIDIDKPDNCPICHNGIDPIFIVAFLKRERKVSYDNVLEVVYRCTKDNCLSFFIATYLKHYTSFHAEALEQGNFAPHSLEPYYPEIRKFSDTISDLSINFCEIYNQARVSEQSKLDLICGLGYRKALEFLIKDYAKQLHPDKEKEIKETFLGICIETYIDDQNIKDCAKLATWLGNDEAHYVRKWKDKDLEDLKTLIELTIRWIESVKLTEKYKKDMDT